MPAPEEGGTGSAMDLVELASDGLRLPAGRAAVSARSNSGLVTAGGGMVVDTFWDLPHTREMIATVRAACGTARRSASSTRITTATTAGATSSSRTPRSSATALCAEQFGARTPADDAGAARRHRQRPIRRMAAMAAPLADWDFAGIELTPPTTLIDDRLELDLDGIRVELLYVGPAHTAGDVHRAPAARARRLHRRRPLPPLHADRLGGDATHSGSRALDTIVALDPAVVVPGHGPLCGVEGPREMKAYLEYVQTRVAARFRRTACRRSTRPSASTSGRTPRWTEPERMLFNVERAYRELRGEPWDAPIDVAALFQGMYELGEAWHSRRSA